MAQILLKTNYRKLGILDEKKYLTTALRYSTISVDDLIKYAAENSGLSKGQLQRLAIARAVLMDRQIFMLDECTSALDAQTEEALLRDLAALNKQAILVTHRPEALAAIPGINFVEMDK